MAAGWCWCQEYAMVVAPHWQCRFDSASRLMPLQQVPGLPLIYDNYVMSVAWPHAAARPAYRIIVVCTSSPCNSCQCTLCCNCAGSPGFVYICHSDAACHRSLSHRMPPPAAVLLLESLGTPCSCPGSPNQTALQSPAHAVIRGYNSSWPRAGMVQGSTTHSPWADPDRLEQLVMHTQCSSSDHISISISSSSSSSMRAMLVS